VLIANNIENSIGYRKNTLFENSGTVVALKRKQMTATPDKKEMAMKTTKQKRVRAKEIGVPTCIWSEAGVVSSRSCTRRLECERCLFDQNMMDFYSYNINPLPAVPTAA
jgi:hypothetical protein